MDRKNEAQEAKREQAHRMLSKRHRVRKMLIEPLQADGMRFRHGTKPEVQRKRLDRMADDLAYLGDEAMICLRKCLRRNAEGAAKCFWPERISYLGFAHSFQFRSIDDEPSMIAWFASAAGQAAAGVPGRLVAEYDFWCEHWHPPFSAQHQRQVARAADENTRRLAYCEDREREGSLRDPEHIAWLRAYRAAVAKIDQWLSAEGSA